MGGYTQTIRKKIDPSAAAVHRALRLHPNLKMPPPPDDATPEAVVAWAMEAVARYLSPPKLDGEDNDHACFDVATAVREHLAPELVRKLRARRGSKRGTP